jgi:hypothetical protein
VISADGSVLVAGMDGYAYSLKSTGALNYKYALAGPTLATPALRADGMAFVGGNSVDFFDAPTGSYSSRSDFAIFISSATVARGRYDATFMYGGFAAVIGAAPFYPGAGVVAPPAVGSDTTDYFGTLAGTLYAANFNPAVEPRASGDLLIPRWIAHIDRPLVAALALSPSGVVYQPVSDGTLRAFGPSGQPLWSTHLGYGLSAPALSSDGTIVVASADKLSAVHPDGTVAWQLAGAFAGSAPSVGKDGTVYVGVDGSALAAVSASGDALFTVRPAGLAQQSRALPQPALGPDNRAYFVAGGSVFAVGP